MTLSLPRIALAAEIGVNLCNSLPVAAAQSTQKILRGDAARFRLVRRERNHAVGVFHRERVVDADIGRVGDCPRQGDLMFIADADGGHVCVSERHLDVNYTIVGKINRIRTFILRRLPNLAIWWLIDLRR